MRVPVRASTEMCKRCCMFRGDETRPQVTSTNALVRCVTNVSEHLEEQAEGRSKADEVAPLRLSARGPSPLRQPGQVKFSSEIFDSRRLCGPRSHVVCLYRLSVKVQADPFVPCMRGETSCPVKKLGERGWFIANLPDFTRQAECAPTDTDNINHLVCLCQSVFYFV